MLETTEKLHLRLLLDHFALIEDNREAWRVAHPLPEELLLVVCRTIAAGDDFEDIADWGEYNLAFLRRFLIITAFLFGLAAYTDESDRSGAVCLLLPGLGGGCHASRCPGLVESRSSQRSGRAAPGPGLRQARAPRLGQEAVAEGS
ncbi:transposase family protein [Mesorhizobium abyssinicae]|uniref:transposase family protein n=1 Tax=Mesorhizobium abyssinicae TaxID=1209958 RepID=UPI00387DD5C1